jgi:hypothetical protein
MGKMKKIQQAWETFKSLFESQFQERAIKEVEEWNGSPGNYSSTDEYCKACLIDLNSAAGNDEKVQALCKLPVREEGDPAGTFVDKGVFAAAGGRGITAVEKPEDVEQDAFDSAMISAANEIISAYEEMDLVAPESVFEIAGRERPEEERAISVPRIFTQVSNAVDQADSLSGTWSWIMDLFMDDSEMFAIVARDGKLFKIPIGILGEDISLGDPVQVTQDFPETAAPMPRSKLTLRETPEGTRWFSISATSVLNRVGEIDSRDLFDSFIAHANETGEYPKRDFFHMGESIVTGQCDFLAREGNAFITSGLYDNSLIAQVEIRARKNKPDEWGDSIAYLPLQFPDFVKIGDVEIPVFRSGHLSFISTLPEKHAANLFTRGTVQEVSRMNAREKEAFVKLFVDSGGTETEADAWLEDNAEVTNRQIEEEGMVTRDDGETGDSGETSTETPDQEEVPTPDPTPEFELDDAALDAIVERVILSEFFVSRGDQLDALASGLQALGEQIDVLSKLNADLAQRLEPLEKDETERQKEYRADMPRKTVPRLTYRPRANGTPQDDNAETAETNADRAARMMENTRG